MRHARHDRRLRTIYDRDRFEGYRLARRHMEEIWALIKPPIPFRRRRDDREMPPKKAA